MCWPFDLKLQAHWIRIVRLVLLRVQVRAAQLERHCCCKTPFVSVRPTVEVLCGQGWGNTVLRKTNTFYLYSVLRLPVHTGATPYGLSGGAVQLALSTLRTWNLPAGNNLDLKSCSTPIHRQSSYSIATAAEPCDYTDITQLIHPIRQLSINFGQPRADTATY